MALSQPSRNLPLVADDGIQPAARAGGPSQHESRKLNSDFSWDDFDSNWYYDHNYSLLRDDDRQIVEVVRDFFATFDTWPDRDRRGIDVGSGTNLYPALTMLPLCAHITLYEYSAPNLSWLEREIQSYAPSWDAFWDLLVKEPLYKSVSRPRKKLAAHAHVEKGSLFGLPESNWDIGTMFFTAESISSAPAEFQVGVRRFIKSLRTGAPFAAAFMENSVGYTVGEREFPAVEITVDDVKACLKDNTEGLVIHQTGLTSNPLRAGYGGMILATGRVVH